MEPRVHGVEYNMDSNLEAMDVDISKEMMLQKRNLLTSTFGTQRSKVQVSDGSDSVLLHHSFFMLKVGTYIADYFTVDCDL